MENSCINLNIKKMEGNNSNLGDALAHLLAPTVERAVNNAIEKSMAALTGHGLVVSKPISLEQASELTGLAKSTIYRLTSRREIPHFKRGGRLYFDEQDLVNWLKENRK